MKWHSWFFALTFLTPGEVSADDWIRAEPPKFQFSFPEPRQLGEAETEHQLEPYFMDHFCGVGAQIFWRDRGEYHIPYGGNLKLDPKVLLRYARREASNRPRPAEVSDDWKSIISWGFIGGQGGTEHIPELEKALRAALQVPQSERRVVGLKRVIVLGSALAALYREASDVDGIVRLLESEDPQVRRVTWIEVADWPKVPIQDHLARIFADESRLRCEPIDRYQDALAKWREADGTRARFEILLYATRRGNNLATSPGGRWAVRKLIELANEDPEVVAEVCREKQRGKLIAPERALCRWALRYLGNPIDGRRREEKRD